MKRPGSTDSLGALISACHSSEEKNQGSSHVYNRGFQSMLEGLDEEDCIEESGHIAEKKRRLSVDQVKALEKNFEVENKLEPERKVKLAQELGLQPRQVAVWFQNRRARWKTKQLEKDYGLLKDNYETLKLNFEVLQHDKESLLAELRDMKSKLQEEKTGSNLSVKEERLVSESENKVIEHGKIHEITVGGLETTDPVGVLVFGDFKDGSSDSDSSAILNEDNSPNPAISSSGALQKHQSFMSPTSSSLRFSLSSSSSPSSSINYFQFSSEARAVSTNAQKAYQQHPFGKMEEHNFFSPEETCDFFSDDQAPTLQWYCPDQWDCSKFDQET